MANEPLIRDPKGQPGKPNLIKNLSKLASMSHRANLAVEQYGLDPAEQALLSQESMVGMDTPSVQNYIVFMSKPLHDWQGTAAELAKFVTPIADLNAQAQLDPLLSKAEKKRVDGYAKYLIQFIHKKTSLLARVKSSFKGVVKTSVTNARTRVSETLSNTPSVLGKLAGLLLKPREQKETADKDVLKARAAALSRMAQLEAKSRATAHTLDEDEDDFEERHPTREAVQSAEPVTPTKPVRASRKTFKTIPEDDGKKIASALTAAKLNDAGTHTRLDKVIVAVTKTNDLLKLDAEQAEQEREAAARAADDRKTTTSLSPVKEPSSVVKKDGGLLSGFGGSLLKLLGAFDLGKFLMPLLSTGVSALGGAFAVAAVAVGAWELGKWLDDLTDHKMSNAVQHFAEQFYNVGGKDAASDAEREEVNLARRRTHNPSLSLAQARQVNKDYVAHPETRKFDNFGKPLTGVSAGVRPAQTPLLSATPGPSVTGLPETAPPSLPVAVPEAPTAPVAPASTTPVKVPVTQMHVSDDGITKLEKREGLQRTPYWDVSGWAIGFGDHDYNGVPLGTDQSQKPNVRLSDADAHAAIRRRVATHFEPIVRKNLGSAKVSQDQFDALVSVAYNSEAAAAKLARRTARGETLKKQDFTASGTVNGQKVPALQARRADEYAQFSTPSSGRAAAPIMALTAATGMDGGNTTIVQTPIVQTGSGSGAGPVIIPQPITVTNTDKSVDMLRSANVT